MFVPAMATNESDEAAFGTLGPPNAAAAGARIATNALSTRDGGARR